MNIFDRYIPHIQAAASRYSDGFLQLMDKLDAINWSISQLAENPGPGDLIQRKTFGGISASQDIGPVPPGEAWIIDYVTGTVAWTLKIGGVAMLSSTLTVIGAPPVLLAGETAQLTPSGAGDFALQITRAFERGKPVPAHTGSGNEGWVTGSSVLREPGRDRLEIGIKSVTPPVVPED